MRKFIDRVIENIFNRFMMFATKNNALTFIIVKLQFFLRHSHCSTALKKLGSGL